MNKEKRIAVIGAGPAGLTAAYCLSKHGVKVDVYEAAPEVGGMCRTIELWDQKVDLGPHRFFSNDKRINELWLEVVEHDYKLVDRLTRIYYKKKFFAYPLQAIDALRKLGATETLRSLQSYFRTKVSKSDNDNSFEYWVTKKFGKRLFEIFFKSYSEKLWGIPCSELDADFAAQRIKKFSLGEAIKHAFKREKKQHHTLVSKFAYPVEGTGMVYDKMKKKIEHNGSNIYLQKPVRSVSQDSNGNVNGIYTTDGMFHEYDVVVSSMPLSIMVKQLPCLPDDVRAAADKLKFRNTIIVYLLVDGVDLFPDNWLYVQEPEVRMGRITNFRNWVPELYGNSNKTILALEYWCYDNDAIWKDADANIIELGKQEMQQTGLLNGHAVSDGYVHRISKCYPVYHKGYKDDLAPIVDYLKTIPNLICIGRYGAFKYNNQDHSILMGILAAENILGNAGHNLWDVNTDYESYQEMSFISETGLVKA